MYEFVMALVFTSGAGCLIVGALKEEDRRWAQKHCVHDDQEFHLVTFRRWFKLYVEVHCSNCDANMELS